MRGGEKNQRDGGGEDFGGERGLKESWHARLEDFDCCAFGEGGG